MSGLRAELERVLGLCEKATRGPYQVIEDRRPWTIEADEHRPEAKHGEHVQRRIFTTWDHPQSHEPSSVVNIAHGIGWPGFVYISEADAEYIVAALNFIAAHGPALLAGQGEDGRDARLAELEALVNSPELHNFSKGAVLEAGHQRERWGTDHDSGKQPHDWFWLVGYLAGKALHAHTTGNTDKALHHTISAAAALANWHGAILGTTNMRPGIDSTAIDAAIQASGSGAG